MSLVTIPNIELIAVGAWKAHGSSPGMSGEVVFTEKDLKAIMASQDAPDVKEPRMILGHTQASVGAETAAEGFMGEQPCIGKFTNLRLSTDGQRIFADLAGVPQWLADIMPTAYPNRSVEVYWDVPSGIAGAQPHECVMPRVALLGVNLPAVATLEDLKVLYSDEGPADVTVEQVAALAQANRRVAASRGDIMPNRVAASVQFEDVRREFYNNFATEESGRYWWWIQAVYVDPPTLIVDDDEETLWSVPYSVAGDSVEFGDPVEIRVQYVEQDSGKVAASMASALGQQYTKAASRPQTRASKENHVPLDTAALRTRLGLTAEQLPDGATEEQINAALAAAPEPEPEGEEKEPEANGEPEGEREESAAEASMTVTVDRQAWENSQRTLAELADDRNKRVERERVGVVTAAVKAGKIPPSRKEHYVKLMQADPEGTSELLDSLESVIPVDQREQGTDDGGNSTQAASGDYDLNWLTDAERARAEAARAGTTVATPRLVMEG